MTGRIQIMLLTLSLFSALVCAQGADSQLVAEERLQTKVNSSVEFRTDGDAVWWFWNTDSSTTVEVMHRPGYALGSKYTAHVFIGAEEVYTFTTMICSELFYSWDRPHFLLRPVLLLCNMARAAYCDFEISVLRPYRGLQPAMIVKAQIYRGRVLR